MPNILYYSIYYLQTALDLKNHASFQKKEFVSGAEDQKKERPSKKHYYFFKKFF
jgi:hypothetical protein